MKKAHGPEITWADPFRYPWQDLQTLECQQGPECRRKERPPLSRWNVQTLWGCVLAPRFLKPLRVARFSEGVGSSSPEEVLFSPEYLSIGRSPTCLWGQVWKREPGVGVSRLKPGAFEKLDLDLLL